ncbi:aspartate kinase [Alkaliphilus peptidifermentans]|uniref:Aspartokinase n=1 Tax=Alkaliphilus peptidifermentans DSM 18978 TaxID=1120976 RepID=A0A1G5L6A8_9FIRM|nr:aspartate kinase [Alkaliphilus peptidifermentans]SCZ08407.1 aspartate kinase [Alkaliphilus peptidifermentans DSM 18978]
MGVKVAKFGGTSLANASQFIKVKEIIMQDKERCFIVPSAPGKRDKEDTKITDLLYLCYTYSDDVKLFNEYFNQLQGRYISIVNELELNVPIKEILEEIKQKIQDGASLDFIVSRGEYINGIILAEYIGYEFIDAAEIIYFNEDGLLDQNKTYTTINKLLSENDNAVIPGFYGSNYNGDIKIFSRGGSDITGAIIACGVEADLYENWTDVSGFLMADPSIVDNPQQIKQITFRELRELSYMGASVLHEETIFPVLNAGIPINIRNTNDPENAGTMIISYSDSASRNGITGVAGKKGFTIITIEKNLMNYEVGFVRRILTVLEKHDIYFYHLPTGIDTISLVLEASQIKDIHSLVKEIQAECKPDSIEIIPGIALIATVGHGMSYTPGIAARLFTALAENNINVRIIDQGSSEINIIVGVEEKDLEAAVRAIYNAYTTKI